MAKDLENGHLYEFRGFQLDGIRRLLSKDGKPVSLAPKALETLLVLVENSGRVVEKTELINRVWPDSFVEEINLTVHISSLRKILGETPDDHQYIVTVPRRGYTFVAPVTEIEATSTEIPVTEDVNFSEQLQNIIHNSGNEAAVQAMAPLPFTVPQEDEKPEILIQPETKKSSRPRWQIALLVAVPAIFLTLTALFFFVPRKAKPSEMSGKAIAVLPFKTLASNGKETFEVSLADALITRLTKVKRLSVKPTSAILVYADRSPDPIAAGRELGVDAIMQGMLQQVGEQVRLTVQMVRVEDGKPIWAEHFDARGSDYFALQDALAEQVLEEINEQMTIHE